MGTNTRLFGTDGIRGKANEYPMTAEVALAVGKSVATIFTRKSEHKRPKIVIGKDPRASSYIFEYALSAGICSMGADVILVGPMPTAATAVLTRSFRADAGIVISASHNHAEDNGIKIFSARGEKLPDSVEHEIEKMVLENNMCCSHVPPHAVGKAYRFEDAVGRYIEYVKQLVVGDLKGMKIVVDCANGAAFRIAPMIFQELGAEVIAINHEPNGLNINLDCGATKPEAMAKAVVEHGTDAGFSLDGDADRVIFSDEKGHLVDGDSIIGMLAAAMKERKKLKKDTVVVTPMSNYGLFEFLRKRKIKSVVAAVGDRYVYGEMKKHGYNLGGEQSGHVILSDYNTTGDGIITALMVLVLMRDRKARLSSLHKDIQKYPQVMMNVMVKERKDIEKLHAAGLIKKAQKTLAGKGRIVVRYSGTEKKCRVMVEGKEKGMIMKIATDVADAIKKEIGA